MNAMSFNNLNLAPPGMNLSAPTLSYGLADKITASNPKTDPKPYILIVSTDEDPRLMYKTILEMWHFEVAESENIKGSVFAADGKPPNLILMDLALPFENNLAAMSEVRKSGSFQNVPILLVSGFSQQQFRDDALSHGAAEFLVKPVDFDLLEKSLKKLLYAGFDSQI